MISMDTRSDEKSFEGGDDWLTIKEHHNEAVDLLSVAESTLGCINGYEYDPVVSSWLRPPAYLSPSPPSPGRGSTHHTQVPHTSTSQGCYAGI